MKTSSRRTRTWRGSIIHTAATQRQRCCSSKHTRERSPGSATASNSTCSFPESTQSKQKPAHNGTFCFYRSTCLRPVPLQVRKKRRYRWNAQRRLPVELRPVPPWVTASFSPVSHMDGRQMRESEEASKRQIHAGESGRLFPSVTHRYPGSSCLAQATLPNWTARTANLASCHHFERDRPPVLLSK